MAEQRNIVVLGASAAGLSTAHYVLQHILPALKTQGDAKYHVYIVNPSGDWLFRVASPRVAASETRMSSDRIVFKLKDGFKQYSPDDITLIEGAATGLNTKDRIVVYKNTSGVQETLSYHALVVATGSSTYYQAFSMSAATQTTIDAVKTSNKKVANAKEIVIVGGGPTAVEFAGEVAEFRNGKPGWFSTPERKVNITLYTAADRLLPQLRPAIGKTAEQKLQTLGVNVVYNAKVVDAKEESSGRTTVVLAKGERIEADLYVPAYGVTPNSSWLPSELLNDKKYLVNNHETLRVDAAGARVYAIGDIGSYSRNNVWDILTALPVLGVNLKRDLLAYSKTGDAKPNGKDRLLKMDLREGMVAPVGSGGGVGVVMGWRLPSFLVYLLKGRDYMLGMSGLPTVSGQSVKKEFKWTAEEAAI